MSEDIPVPQRFGEKLRILRTKHGLTLRELAKELGLPVHTHITLVENGKREPSLKFVIKIARYFKVSIDMLLDDEQELDE
jgi:transcriptional regulator with XRE-family HTH domain